MPNYSAKGVEKMRALARLQTLDPNAGNIRAWLLGIARNVLNEHRQRAIRRKAGHADGPTGERALSAIEDSITRASEVIARGEQHRILMVMIESLDTEDTLLVTWHGLERRSLAEAASRLGITRDAAAKRWQRLLKQLRDRGMDLGLFEPDA